MSNNVVSSYRFPPPCVDATYENLPTETLIGRIVGTGRQGMAFRADSGHVMYEKLIKSVKFKLDDDGNSPNQTIYARVRDSSGSIVDTFGSMSATALSGTPTEFTFDTTEIQTSAGDIITLEYGDNSPAIQARVFRTATASYIANASTLVATTDLTSWAGFYDYDWFYVWLECDYCS